MNFYRPFISASTVLFCCISFSLLAQNPAYTQRQQDYVTNMSALPNNGSLILQAYTNTPLDTALLHSKLNYILTNTTSDFEIIELIRVLFLTNGAYDADILPVINSVPYWINYGDTVHNYWSENHMIMWMSSDWLLHEKYGKPIDATLEARLKHYLELKRDYGFYEFFSSVYNPYAFSGIVNLADFAQDTTIKNLATQAAQILLKDFLMLANDKGVFFPAAGRNYPGKYLTPYGQNHNNLIYLLTGMGDAPTSPSAAGPFLATSTLPVDGVINSWVPTMDTIYHIGHTLEEGFVLNSAMDSTDKTVLQWTSGAYFHPEVVLQTAKLLTDSNMWHHVDFALLQPLSNLPPSGFTYFANSLTCVSESSVICGENVAIYKHNAITLSSVLDFWKGKVGFQEWPCVANVGTTAVFTASGQVFANWDDRSATNQNSHLPYVAQKKNLALIMYRPEKTDAALGAAINDHKEVALHFNDADFDEVAQDSLWLLGRQGGNYVAVLRPCIDTINGIRYCPNPLRQSWVIFLGDSILYNSFTNFQDIVHQSNFTEEYYYDSLTSQSVYYAKIVMGNDSIEYAWGRDSAIVGVTEYLADKVNVNVYPNPANDNITIQTQNIKGNCVVQLYSMEGRLVYSYKGNAQLLNIPVSQLNSGLYAVKLFTADGKMLTRKVVITH